MKYYEWKMRDSGIQAFSWTEEGEVDQILLQNDEKSHFLNE